MTKIHINQATPEQLDYAVAIARKLDVLITSNGCEIKKEGVLNTYWEKYSPTTSQDQGGELIDKFKIYQKYDFDDEEWMCRVADCDRVSVSEFRLVAAVKAVLWFFYPDGMIEVANA
jgi:hypothetical protein